jgi:hypothetical protein
MKGDGISAKRLLAAGFGGAFAVAVLAATMLVAAAPSRAAGPPKPCCFTNDRYAGTCKVVPGDGETCQSVLAYLNNPMSTGKAYCDSTNVRGGWTLVSCDKGMPAKGGTPASAANGQRGTPVRAGGATR